MIVRVEFILEKLIKADSVIHLLIQAFSLRKAPYPVSPLQVLPALSAEALQSLIDTGHYNRFIDLL